MHAPVQSGGRSPKRLNGPTSTQQLKSSPESLQNNGTPISQIKGKKRDRGDQSMEPIKRELMTKADDGDSAVCKFYTMLKAEISKITEKGALISTDGVEKLVQLMHVDTNRKVDLTGRVLLADVIAATDRIDCLNKFVQIMGVPVLDEWLQEAHKGKAGVGSSPKEGDKAVEELLLSLLHALDKLPVNLNALQTCNIGKSVNHLRSHKNLEIQKKARSLVDTWKKRVDAEMKTNEAKPVGSNQAVTWPAKPGFPEAAQQQTVSPDLSIKSSITQQSTFKVLPVKIVHADGVKSTSPIAGSAKLQSSTLASVAISSNDSLPKVTVGNGTLDLPQMVTKEEISSSSSQSQNNSQSCSSDHTKKNGRSLKEDARSLTARSMNASKTSGDSSRHRKSRNGVMENNISGGQKETNTSRSASINRSLVVDKVSLSVMKCERIVDMPVSDNGSSHSLIVRLPNLGRSPTRSTIGGSLEDPSVSSRPSSRSVPDKHEHGDHRGKARNNTARTHSSADVNVVSWQNNDGKEGLVGCVEISGSPTIIPDEDSVGSDEAGRATEISRAACSSSGDERSASFSDPMRRNSFSSMNVLVEGCAKYSEITSLSSAGDDIDMNLHTSVATGAKPDFISLTAATGDSLVKEDPCTGANEVKLRFSADNAVCQNLDPHNGNADFDSQKDAKERGSVVMKDEIQRIGPTVTDDGKTSTPSLEDFKESGREDVHQIKNKRMVSRQVCDGCKLEARSPVDETKEKVAEGSICASNSYKKLLSNGFGGKGYEQKPPLGKEVQGHVTLTGQHLPYIAEFVAEVERGGNAVTSSNADKIQPQKNVDLLMTISCDDMKDSFLEVSGRNVSTEEHNRFADSHHGIANGAEVIEKKDSIECHVRASVSNDELPKIPSESDASARREELESSPMATSFIISSEQAGAKLGFDLNEGIPGDDLNQIELVTAGAPICSTEIRIPRLSPFASSPTSSGLLAPITIAAPTKGSFLPPENLLKNKGEPGWKGSAATSAFRPAEPRKVLEISPSTSDVQLSDSAMAKEGRYPLDIDLNVPDERTFEDTASQNSAQTAGSKSGVISNFDASVRAITGLDLDLNRFGEGLENSHCSTSSIHRLEVLHFPRRPASEAISNRKVDMLRKNDPNNVPVIDVVVTEPVPRSQTANNSSNASFVPAITGLKLNNAELGNGWFPAGNSYPAIAIPSFLPDRGEPSYPIVAAAGGHRILGSITGAGTYRTDIYRGPVLSSSPAVAFSSAATTFSYAGFPFTTGFPVTSTSFSAESAGCGACIPPIASQLVGPAVAVSSPYSRPYVISLPDGSASGGSEGRRKWGRQVLDLNAGSGSAGEVKERLPLFSRETPAANMHTFVEDQTRLYQVGGGSLKRKEPEAGWKAGKFDYRQPSWQ